MIHASAPRQAAIWLSPADIARRLGVSRWTALRRMKDEGDAMGAQLAYKREDGSERWHCNADRFEAWMRAKGLTG